VKAEVILVLGGARSGKSRFAQKLAGSLGKRVTYVAPLEPLDEEMRQRVELHRKSRPGEWHTLEAPTGVAKALREQIAQVDVVLLDCLTLLVSNIMGTDSGAAEFEEIDCDVAQKKLNAELKELLECIKQSSASLIIVSNEVGSGLVPPYPLGRAFRDLLGEANQYIAARADKVYLIVAGLPVEIKRLATQVSQSLDTETR
jgi:adenosylcobinamide kinase/adenosylcobinamide-phosphate guanylyltransferase